MVSRPAAEKLLRPPHADRATVWALATLACLLSGDYRNAREPPPSSPSPNLGTQTRGAVT